MTLIQVIVVLIKPHTNVINQVLYSFQDLRGVTVDDHTISLKHFEILDYIKINSNYLKAARGELDLLRTFPTLSDFKNILYSVTCALDKGIHKTKSVFLGMTVSVVFLGD